MSSESISKSTNRSLLVVQVFMLCISVAGVSFLAGVWFSNATDSAHNNASFNLFWQSWDILEDEYYYDLPETKQLVYGAVQGLLAAVGDNYTFFVPPTEAEFDRQVTAGEFGGIGAHVSQTREGQIVIVSAFADLPAEKAGLEAGDIILAVDGVSLEGWSLDRAVALLRGEVGSEVTLTLFRPSEDREFTASLIRARLEIQTVLSQMYDDVAYVRLFRFSATATSTLEREIKTLLEQNPRALILDLRGNPGGLLDQAVSVSDLFLEEGVVVKQRTRAGDEKVYYSSEGDITNGLPIVVLLDNGSASASEVVAGALRDRDRAVLIGQTSFGKGLVQYVHDMPDGSQLHVTVAIWLTPDDVPIHGQGLAPDVPVEIPENYSSDEDLFVEVALSYLNGEDIDTPATREEE